jgi:N6-adenosine-specific RNA methylase IME4
VTVALVRYDAACKALAAAKSTDEALRIRGTAEAMRAYARVANNRALEIDAAEIRMRAERRVGELIRSQKETVGLAKPGERGGRKRKIDGSRTDPSNGRPTLAEAGIDKHLADRARTLARLPGAQFDAMLGEWRERIEHQNDRVTTNLVRELTRTEVSAARPPTALPSGAFRLLYADPPWQYEHVKTESRAIENQYPTMPLDEIRALRVPAADDAVLFFWSTSPKLAEALTVVEAWGFSYRTCAVWDKGVIGMGYYFRQQHELLLVAARGALPVPAPSTRVASIFRAPRAAHSAKPVIAYELLEAMYPAFGQRDRVELFARPPYRPGWTPWSNEPAMSPEVAS